MIDLICACTDLGVHLEGTEKGPILIANLINNKNINKKIIIKKNSIIKKKNHDNLLKNFEGINAFSKELFERINYSINNNLFPITLGGDHTVAIGSILASLNNYDDLGVIWIDAHADFNTFETTETGNIHGLPLAAVCGLCTSLSDHLSNKYVNPKKCVIVGARSIDKNEINNLRKYGVTFFTTNDIKKEGVNHIMDKAFAIAGKKVHVSYDLDIIDPTIAKGVSIPENNGINKEEAFAIINYLRQQKDKVVSFDLVEYNPTFDNNNKTLNLAVDLLHNFLCD